MTLENRLKDDIKTALKTGQKEKLNTLRTVFSQVKDEWIKKRQELTDQDVIAVLTRAVKSRKDSIEMYKKGKREDLVEKETAELELILSYLPEQLSEEEIKQEIKMIIDSAGVTDLKDIGKIMGPAMAKLKGKADGKVVQLIARSLLSWNEMNYFDLTFFLVASYVTVRGLFRGLISELMVLVAIILGFMLATFFHPYLQNLVLHFLPNLPVTLVKIISFMIIFIGINILIRILANMLNKIATFTFLQPVNKLAGAVFAFLKVTLIFSILLIIIELIPGSDYIFDTIGSKESISFSFVKEFGPFLYNIFFSGSESTFKDLIPFETSGFYLILFTYYPA